MIMKDRVVLVTGASRGIGAATAKLLASEGASVAVNWFQSEDAAKDVVNYCELQKCKAIGVRADVRDPDQVQGMVKEVESALGPIDTLIINAAISFPMESFLEYSWEDFGAKLTGEIRAAFNCCKAVIPGMIERKNGCIIAVSSTLSRSPGHGFSAHSTAKSGLDGLMKSLAYELGPNGIRVNVIAPGLTRTDATASQPPQMFDMIAGITPLRRIAEPEDIAGAVLMLASDQSRFITGAYIPVSGGAYMP